MRGANDSNSSQSQRLALSDLKAGPRESDDTATIISSLKMDLAMPTENREAHSLQDAADRDNTQEVRSQGGDAEGGDVHGHESLSGELEDGEDKDSAPIEDDFKCSGDDEDDSKDLGHLKSQSRRRSNSRIQCHEAPPGYLNPDHGKGLLRKACTKDFSGMGRCDFSAHLDQADGGIMSNPQIIILSDVLGMGRSDSCQRSILSKTKREIQEHVPSGSISRSRKKRRQTKEEIGSTCQNGRRDLGLQEKDGVKAPDGSLKGHSVGDGVILGISDARRVKGTYVNKRKSTEQNSGENESFLLESGKNPGKSTSPYNLRERVKRNNFALIPSPSQGLAQVSQFEMEVVGLQGRLKSPHYIRQRENRDNFGLVAPLSQEPAQVSQLDMDRAVAVNNWAKCSLPPDSGVSFDPLSYVATQLQKMRNRLKAIYLNLNEDTS